MSYVRKQKDQSESPRLAPGTASERLPVPAPRELLERKVLDLLRAGERKQAALHADGRDDSRSALSDVSLSAKKKPSRRVPSARATAVSASRTYLAGVLIPATPHMVTPSWKEDVVDRVRRRVGERIASATLIRSSRTMVGPGGSPSLPGDSGVGDSPDPFRPESFHRPDSPVFSPRPPAASPRQAQSARATRTGAGQPAWSSPPPPSLLAALGSRPSSSMSGISRSGISRRESAPASAVRRGAVQDKSRQLDHYRDALSDQLLVRQLHDKEGKRLVEELRQVERRKLERASTQPSGPAGMAQAARLRSEAERKLQTLSVLNSRLGEGEAYNAALVRAINVLRRDRREFLRQIKQGEERERVFAADMRGFSASAHGALDDKERAASKLRRLQHEEKAEAAEYARVFDDLGKAELNLDRQIAAWTASSASLEEESRRVRYVALQAGRSATTAREQRLAYLQAQLDGLRSECGQLALLTGTPFEPQKAASIAAVVDSLKQNEARNASLHSFLQVEQAQVEAVKDDIGRLTLEADLIERGAQAANGARTDGATEAESESEALQVMVEGTSAVEWRLKQIVPVLSRLLARYAGGAGLLPTPGSTAHLTLRGGEEENEPRLGTVDGVVDGMRLLDGALEELRLRVARLMVSRPDAAARRAELEALLRVGEPDADGDARNRYKQLELLAQNGGSAFGADLE